MSSESFRPARTGRRSRFWLWLALAGMVVARLGGQQSAGPLAPPPVAELRAGFGAPLSRRVFVVAHRAGWRNFPENTVAAIRDAVARRFPMIEIDVRRTRDGGLVLMHDPTVDRTTTGTGRVEDLTLAEIRALRIRDGLGMPTEFQVPTLEEALVAARGTVLVNLDKSYGLIADIVPVLEATGTGAQALFKGDATPAAARDRYGALMDRIWFMPVVHLDRPDGLATIQACLDGELPPAIEFVFPEWTPVVDRAIALCREKGVRVWMNTLWPQLAGGFSDDRALADPDRVYGLLIERGVSVLQTDRPTELLAYLAHREGTAR